MKKSLTVVYTFAMLLFFNCLTMFALAQESASTSTTSTTTKTSTNEFYMQPWMWVVGGVIVLIILVALFRGGGSDRSETRTTIIR